METCIIFKKIFENVQIIRLAGDMQTRKPFAGFPRLFAMEWWARIMQMINNNFAVFVKL